MNELDRCPICKERFDFGSYDPNDYSDEEIAMYRLKDSVDATNHLLIHTLEHLQDFSKRMSEKEMFLVVKKITGELDGDEKGGKEEKP